MSPSDRVLRDAGLIGAAGGGVLGSHSGKVKRSLGCALATAEGQRRKLLHLAANVIRVSNPKDDESPYKKLSAWAREAVKVQYPEGFIEIPAPDSANKAGHGWATRIYDLHFGPGGLEEEQFRAVLFWPMGPHNNDKQIHPVMGFHPKTDQELDDFWKAIESVRKHSNYPELLEGLNRCFVAWPLCVS